MNPYARFLENRDAPQVIAGTPQQLQSLIETLGKERTEQSPAPGKWSAREIVCHLADCEIVFAFRLRQALAEDHHMIQPFDQDKWASTYPKYDVQSALAVFRATRFSPAQKQGRPVKSRVLMHVRYESEAAVR